MKEQLNTILQKRWTVPTITAVAGFGVGTLAGYMFTKQQYDRIEAELERVDRETEKIEQYQLDFNDAALIAEVERRVSVEIEKRMPEILGTRGLGYFTETEVDDDEARDALREDHPTSVSKATPTHARRYTLPPLDSSTSTVRRELEPDTVIGKTTDIRHNPEGILVEGSVTPIRKGVITNVFDNAGDEWDYKTEIERRDKTRPYVIHVDEYMTDEMDWNSQSTLTWYEKDRILTDSHDKPIHNPNEVVGLPLQFGHGSNDPNVIYIRNERLQAEYEILRDSGSYQELVLGEDMEAAAENEELRHSHQMRFRQT